VQDRDVDLPRRRVAIDQIDAAVARRYKVDPAVLKTHGRHAGPAKAVAVALAARLAGTTCRAIAEHYGIGSSAVAATERRLADRPELMEAMERLLRQLGAKKAKYNVLQQDFSDRRNTRASKELVVLA